ncbi:multiple cyclophane-containing RiPP AmcA [Plantactinospora sp. KLBMP9567]|uniref:multiple cyclophane-containing RiPP AmcA n=1 Tax=Plantactinospora sp. KLBMP9567 TaxID=3085900 RepID=UPI0029821AE9|nr:multiple cyclophane-containing RiPP AmcA [Plantactinospora sp. KLBMP9567]MDW5325735.1 multiple cyclophane-containing RiPP AmcA [Plantactinospora sp. KLBMP9567]
MTIYLSRNAATTAANGADGQECRSRRTAIGRACVPAVDPPLLAHSWRLIFERSTRKEA